MFFVLHTVHTQDNFSVILTKGETQHYQIAHSYSYTSYSLKFWRNTSSESNRFMRQLALQFFIS